MKGHLVGNQMNHWLKMIMDELDGSMNTKLEPFHVNLQVKLVYIFKKFKVKQEIKKVEVEKKKEAAIAKKNARKSTLYNQTKSTTEKQAAIKKRREETKARKEALEAQRLGKGS